MKIEKIKPIPKYLLERIRKADRRDPGSGTGHTRFYAYLTKNDGELVRVTVAVRNRREQWYCKQVAVHGVHSDRCFVKDMIFSCLGGYHVGWYDQGLQKRPKWYESDEWGWNIDKYFQICAPTVNREYLSGFPEYRYSAVDLYPGPRILPYLRIYEQFPQVEYLMKAGFSEFAFSKTILRKAGKDKRFRKWLSRNRETLTGRNYYVSDLLGAYRTGKDPELLHGLHRFRLELGKEHGAEPLRELFRSDPERFYTYLREQKISVWLYNDYLRACRYLELDMTEEKNRYPRDFRRWHDIRADEYRTAKALKDEQERKELYARFSAVAGKYLAMESGRGGYAVILARSPADLIREGESLHHCVGRMGYDRKMIREESLIFFVRRADEPDKPFVTVEYSLTGKRILQCYADGNRTPGEEVLHYLRKSWLPYANRTLRSILRKTA